MILLWLFASGCAHQPAPVVTDLAAPAPIAPLDPAVAAALEAGAADLDVSVRRDAIAALVAADPAPSGGQWAQRGRFDPSEYVQRATVAAVESRLREPAARTLLRSLVDDTTAGPWVRGSAAIALALGAATEQVPADEREGDRARITAAATQEPGGRGGALQLAAAILGDSEATTRLSEQLAAGNLPLELWFFRALGRSGLTVLTPPLITALNHVEPEIQLPVAAALLDLGAPAGERALVAALSEGDDRALEALEYLAEARAPAADTILKGALLGGPAVRAAAASALYGRGQGDLRDMLRLLGDDNTDARLLAAVGVGRRLRLDSAVDGADRLRAALRSLLPGDNSGVQLAAIDALGGSRLSADRAALAALLSDESSRIRVAAAVALAR